MVVGLPETATFGMFIKTLTKDYNKTHPKNPVEETLEAWIVEFPSLPKTDFNFRLKDLIKGYSHLQFVVREDPKYAKGPQKDKILLRVFLPTGEYKTMAFRPDQRMHAVLTGMCAKFKMDPSDHLLFYGSSVVSRDLTVNDVASGDLKLVERSKTLMNSVESEEGKAEIFWYGKLARKYKRYSVICRKKKGKAQVVLGIDGEHITMFVVKKTGASKQSTKNPISQVMNCSLSEEGGLKFTLELQGKAAFLFEAASNDVAREIVGKVRYLMKMQ
eukprot:TRINITY_DN920_c0_g1_i2.p1 TRINITY_DN920_c0_g1~~TRINITY_DN920_c0_g1_i2.p1  ORF type:complete len:273 (+),score=62.46 TRINITY_DN920_c0_g1_i2:825-1643(+)